MLESLVSSRIRRTLIDYLLSHPTDRFYLRGLSKDLELSLSPLRRELKRLEQSGLLKTEPEGNMLFYTVNTTSTLFQELNSLKAKAQDAPVLQSPSSAIAGVHPVLPVVKVRPRPLFAWAAAAVLLIVIAGFSLVLSKRQPASVTVIMPSSSSGVMRGARWQVVPGAMGGGFGADTDKESY